MNNAIALARALANTRDFDTNLRAQEAVDNLAHEAEVEKRMASNATMKYWMVEYEEGESRYGRYGYYTKWHPYCDYVWAETPRDAAHEIMGQGYVRVKAVSIVVDGCGSRVPKSEWE